MKNENTAAILTRLESGFRANAATLKSLEDDLIATMVLSREAGSSSAPSESWTDAWQLSWNEVMESVRRINAHLVTIGEQVIGNEEARIDRALVIWDKAQLEDAKLLANLRMLRAQASELKLTSRKEWNRLARLIESHLETIHTSAQALRVKLELLKKHSTEEVDSFVESMRTGSLPQPGTTPASPEPFDRDFRNAGLQRERDQHVFAGFLDVVKGLSMWVESPDERMRKNRSLTLDEA